MLKGAFQLTVALLSELEAGASADYPSRVINIGSVHGIAAPEWESYAYSASKAAIHQLTVHMAKRLGKEHILVNAIAPGPFPSRMMDKLIEAEGEGLVAETATGRLGIAEDMAGRVDLSGITGIEQYYRCHYPSGWRLRYYSVVLGGSLHFGLLP